MATRFDNDESVMQRALELARRGEGFVEPNPMVGAVLVDDDRRLLGEGFHDRFGGLHAEIHTLNAAGDNTDSGTLFVTLEPCNLHGKTGPCVEAMITAGIRRVVVGTGDPNPEITGRGIAELRSAGVAVETGLLEHDCRHLIAPFAKWITTGMPWVHAKWAMTLDGKIATRTGQSRWISNDESRRVVHVLRGKMDAVIVGAETAERDDPLLTARPAGPRTATRIVVSRSARLKPESQLANTTAEGPVVVTATENAAITSHSELVARGVEILRLPRLEPASEESEIDLQDLLRILGTRNATNVLVEGGGRLLGALFDAGLIDEVHVFFAPKLSGGEQAVSPIGGLGHEQISRIADLDTMQIEILDGDVYIRGRLRIAD